MFVGLFMIAMYGTSGLVALLAALSMIDHGMTGNRLVVVLIALSIYACLQIDFKQNMEWSQGKR